MALHWDVTNVEDYETRCFYRAAEDDPSGDYKKGDRLVSALTNTLIWASMSVGLSGITEKNWRQWYARMHACEKLGGAWRFRVVRDEDGKPTKEPVFVTPEDVYRHIGLSTNVGRETDAQWRKRIVQRHLDDFARSAARAFNESFFGSSEEAA